MNESSKYGESKEEETSLTPSSREAEESETHEDPETGADYPWPADRFADKSRESESPQ